MCVYECVRVRAFACVCVRVRLGGGRHGWLVAVGQVSYGLRAWPHEKRSLDGRLMADTPRATRTAHCICRGVGGRIAAFQLLA